MSTPARCTTSVCCSRAASGAAQNHPARRRLLVQASSSDRNSSSSSSTPPPVEPLAPPQPQPPPPPPMLPSLADPSAVVVYGGRLPSARRVVIGGLAASSVGKGCLVQLRGVCLMLHARPLPPIPPPARLSCSLGRQLPGLHLVAAGPGRRRAGAAHPIGRAGACCRLPPLLCPRRRLHLPLSCQLARRPDVGEHTHNPACPPAQAIFLKPHVGSSTPLLTPPACMGMPPLLLLRRLHSPCTAPHTQAVPPGR